MKAPRVATGRQANTKHLVRSAFESKYVNESIVDGMALAMFTDNWFSKYENGEAKSKPDYQEIKTYWRTYRGYGDGRNAVAAAKVLANQFVKQNGVKSMSDLYSRAVEAGAKYDTTSEAGQNFGWYLAMQSMGHGVSWFDDHPEFPITFPRTEFYT